MRALFGNPDGKAEKLLPADVETHAAAISTIRGRWRRHWKTSRKSSCSVPSTRGRWNWRRTSSTPPGRRACGTWSTVFQVLHAAARFPGDAFCWPMPRPSRTSAPPASLSRSCGRTCSCRNCSARPGAIRGTGNVSSTRSTRSLGCGVSLVDVRDNAAVAAMVLSERGHEGKIYEITGPAALTFDEMADVISGRHREEGHLCAGDPMEHRAEAGPRRDRRAAISAGGDGGGVV